MRAFVYIDGFNLYYGLKHYSDQYGRIYKWLDLAKLCRALLPRDRVVQIRYFTALVTPRPNNPDQATRQQIYLRALQTLPNLSIDYGHFLQTYPRMAVHNPGPRQPRIIEVIKTEEKGSDVNLATRLLCDGFANAYELAVIISNDSDLCLPIEVVRTDLKLQVGVLNPTQGFSGALYKRATFYKKVPEQLLAASQFPPMLADAQGPISKPSNW